MDFEDEMAQRIEDANFKHLNLIEEVEDKRRELARSEKELSDFEDEYREYLVR